VYSSASSKATYRALRVGCIRAVLTGSACSRPIGPPNGAYAPWGLKVATAYLPQFLSNKALKEDIVSVYSP